MRALVATLLVAALAVSAATTAAAEVLIRALPVPATTIHPGEVIAPEQLVMRQFRTTPDSITGVITEAADAIGKQARGHLTAGKPIVVTKLGAPVLIRRGQRMTAHYRERGFSISTSVIALSDGIEGSIIDARGVDTGALIKVEVLEGGELTVIEQ